MRAVEREVFGKVYLVGAGPGDPELLTLRAARLLARAEVVVYDHLVGPGILDLLPASARRVYAGKEAGHHALPQEETNRLLIELAREGISVIRLKGGDPFIFGRGGEEMEALEAAGIACEIVPGITSAAGVGAYAGIPLTHRDHARTLIFTTGHLKDGSPDLDWPALARPQQTVVIYMGLGALAIICQRLIEHGLDPATPGVVVQSASTSAQRTVHASIAELPDAVRDAGLKSPSLIVIGPVTGLYRPERERECCIAARVVSVV